MLLWLLVFVLCAAGNCRQLWRLEAIPRDFLKAFHADTDRYELFNPQSNSVVTDPAGGDNRVLKVIYHRGSYNHHGQTSGMLQFFSRPVSRHSALTLSYDIYFDPNFDFVRGGKLPGLWGGLKNCSGGRHSDDCFSTRFMWVGHGDGLVYGYITPPDKQAPGFCAEKYNECYSVYGYGLGRGKWRFRRGEWQNIAQYVKLNTPGQTDGVIRVWFNHRLVYEVNNVNIRQKDSVKIDGIFFSTFFGGNDISWAPPHDTYACFKNFVLSTNAHHPVIVG